MFGEGMSTIFAVVQILAAIYPVTFALSLVLTLKSKSLVLLSFSPIAHIALIIVLFAIVFARNAADFFR